MYSQLLSMHTIVLFLETINYSIKNCLEAYIIIM